jgi:glyoxylase-like metal-dependent hydrolase (beta-lactamase superfamily II)
MQNLAASARKASATLHTLTHPLDNPFPIFCTNRLGTYPEGMPITHMAATDSDLIRARATVGSAEITVCTDGTCRFDGGAMFGVVPKTMWSQRVQPDDLNRVEIGLNCVLISLQNKRILVETGFGNKLSPRLKEAYSTQELLPASLAAAGVTPADIDIVINTHLHWDHCGWNSTLDADGTARPYFPNAQYIAHRGEVEHGRRQHERDRISYVPANYEPMIATNQMRLIEGTEADVIPGIRLECFPGHTHQLMAVHIQDGGEHACFISDLIPTTAHLDLTWAMGFDLDPLRVIEERKRFYEGAIPEKWLVLFPHDHQRAAAYLTRDEKQRVCVISDSTARIYKQC